ncbi:MAG: WD40 repeat domain-containing protein, partial [bacterium]
MSDSASWDWQTGKKIIADLTRIRGDIPIIDELAVSPDGEQIAALGKTSTGEFAVCVNDEVKPERFELCWRLLYSPWGSLTALARIDDEWTLVVDGVPWNQRFEYAWNPLFSPDGKSIAICYKRDMLYGVAVNDNVWEEGFQGMRDVCLSPTGGHAAATVQVAGLKEADVPGFFNGVWSLARDGKPWPEKYVNVWNPAFSADGKSIAAEIRTDICEYTIAVDGEPWRQRFGGVWSPVFHAADNSVIAPARVDGGWTLVKNGEVMWNGRFIQIWHQRISPVGTRVAAVVSPEFGRWTMAVDDEPWKRTFADMVLAPVFSPDGARIAAPVKENNRWTVAVDGVVPRDS